MAGLPDASIRAAGMAALRALHRRISRLPGTRPVRVMKCMQILRRVMQLPYQLVTLRSHDNHYFHLSWFCAKDITHLRIVEKGNPQWWKSNGSGAMAGLAAVFLYAGECL